ATPVPESAAVAPSAIDGPPTVAPAAGAVSDAVGAVLSTRAVRTALRPMLPETSVATARTSNWPAATAVVSKSAANGAVVSVATVAKSAAPTVFTWNCTEATPDVASLAPAESVTTPPTTALSAGAVTEPDGAALSTVFADRSVVDVLPARSVTRKRRS